MGDVVDLDDHRVADLLGRGDGLVRARAALRLDVGEAVSAGDLGGLELGQGAALSQRRGRRSRPRCWGERLMVDPGSQGAQARAASP